MIEADGAFLERKGMELPDMTVIIPFVPLGQLEDRGRNISGSVKKIGNAVAVRNIAGASFGEGRITRTG
ncbi:hypothetical protein D3C75_1062980 [compost metagenome]